ncbi:MAG: tail fiber domain-containing protein [Gammaproteobacteria bacterium]|nr:tail fiber domain-containing protein [Gammaproteobacteria bacterium]
MSIDENKKGRSELKTYFAKNAIPTEKNFAEFIDSVLNQRDDGLVKEAGNPLSIQAAGDDTSQKKAINFYQNFADKKPSWVFSLNPRSKPEDPESTRLGFSISDMEGNSRLFIDRDTGNVGIGTTEPGQFGLRVRGRAGFGPIPTDYNWQYHFDAGTTKECVRFDGPSNGMVSLSPNLEFYVDEPSRPRARFVIKTNGNVGIGVGTPKHKLDVAGEVFARDGIFIQGNRSTHLEQDGSFYRYNGQVYITVDDNLYIKDTGGSIKFHFDTDGGKVGIGTIKPLKHIHIQEGSITAPLLNESRRPGIALTGQYPELNLFSRVSNANHGPTIRLGSYDAATGDKTKQWVIGTAGRNSHFLDFGFSTTNNGNPHNGIRSHSGKTVLTLLENGNVGIGTPDPKATLDVRGAVFCGNSDIYFTKTDHKHTGIGNTSGHAAIENAKDYDALMILGRMGTNKKRKVRLWDYLKVEGTLANLSDVRSKKDIQNLEYGLEEVKKLRPVSFNWRKIHNEHESIGLIGHEVQAVIDKVVYDDNGELSISYVNIIPILINAIKELDDKFESISS